MTLMSSHVLLARMEASCRETRHHLDLVLRQIAARAERVTVTQKAKSSGRTSGLRRPSRPVMEAHPQSRLDGRAAQ